MPDLASDDNSSATSSTGAPPLYAGQFELETSPQDRDAAALDLMVARRMWYGGFAGLPWLWFISWLHFRHAAKLPSAHPELGKYATRSGVCAVIGGMLFLAWIVYVQTTWRTWGDFGRSFMIVIPEEPEEL